MKKDAAHADNTDLLLTFHGDTVDLLRRTPDDARTIIYRLSRRTSIKDILEGLGVPHIYWQGSHHHNMTALLERIVDKTR